MSERELREMIDSFYTPRNDGKYFEMFAIENHAGEMVGLVSLFQHTGEAISAGPEIFVPYRGRSYGTAALQQAYAHAGTLGYRIAVAQVRTNNPASIALHRKCGFEADHEYINQKGNHVIFFIRAI